MLNQDRNQDKTRVQLDLSPIEIGRVNQLMELADLSTRKDLFNNALSLFEWAVLQVFEGNEVCSINKATKEMVVLSMPALSSVQRRRDLNSANRLKPEGTHGSVSEKRSIIEEPLRRVISAGG